MPEKELTLRIGRREFSRQAVVAILSAATITIVDCGGGDSSPSPAPTPPPGGGGGGGGNDVAGAISGNHGHTAVVTAAQITAANSVTLDIRGTAFQWRVWRELTAIPRGQTRSYGDVARAIGQPRAVRAVARACATNPIAVVVPCHRVISADGSAGGYRWGIDTKRRLLSGERRRA